MTSREDFYWSDEAKRIRGIDTKKVTYEKGKEISIVHIELDKTTLPKDGQLVSFQTQDEEWHKGYFIDGDQLFWINDSKWYSAFDVVSWRQE